jgi:hypothetical protein
VADDIALPNGIAVTADNSTLIVADSYRHQLVAFDIGDDGGLSGRRVWADLGEAAPDGICVDAEDTVWYADVPNKRCVRVAEEGAVLRTVELDRGGFACALGGPGRRRCSSWPPNGGHERNGGEAQARSSASRSRYPEPAGHDARSQTRGILTADIKEQNHVQAYKVI